MSAPASPFSYRLRLQHEPFLVPGQVPSLDHQPWQKQVSGPGQTTSVSARARGSSWQWWSPPFKRQKGHGWWCTTICLGRLHHLDWMASFRRGSILLLRTSAVQRRAVVRSPSQLHRYTTTTSLLRRNCISFPSWTSQLRRQMHCATATVHEQGSDALRLAWLLAWSSV
jgi:hypothetical protein